MPIDASIPLRSQAPQGENILDTYGKALSLKQLMQQSQEQDQQVQRQEAVRKIFRESQGRVTPELINRLREVDPAAAFAIEKQMGDAARDQAGADKLGAETEQQKINNQIKKARRFAEILDSVKDEASKDQAIRAAVEAGVVDKKTAAEWFFFPYDETTKAEIERMKSESLTIAEKLEDQHRAATQKRQTEQDAETARHNKAMETPASEREFQPYYQSWLAAKGIAKPTAADQFKAREEFRKGPLKVGEDVPFPKDVANQRKEITAAGRANIEGLTNSHVQAANSLRDDFRIEAKDFVITRDFYDRIKVSAEDPSAAGDLSLIFSYMKILDPVSVVREGEQATAANARGVPEALRNLYNKIMTGEKLGPNQRKDFVDRAKRIMGAAVNRQRDRQKTFSSRAKRLGLPEDLVFSDQTTGIDDVAPTDANPKTAEEYLKNLPK